MGSSPIAQATHPAALPATRERGRSLLRALASALALAWAVVTLTAAAGTIAGAAARGEADFFTFLDSAAQWRRGAALYVPLRTIGEGDAARPVHPNLNHPLTIPALAPLTALPRPVAFLLWDALGLLAFGSALALAVRAAHLRLSPAARPLAVALLVTCPGIIYGLQLGQVGLLLTLPVVALWLGLRRPGAEGARGLLVAGALAGATIALKPFLLPLALFFLPRRRWAGLVAIGVGGVTVSALALPLVGLGAYRDWLAALARVDWHDHGMNIALAGLLTRVWPGSPAVGPWLIQALALGLGAVAVLRARGAGPGATDRAVGLLLVLGLLGSPLGWLYYTPLLLPALLPACAAWPTLPAPRRRLLAAACALLWTPHILLALLPNDLWAELSLRAAPTYGLLLLALFLLTPHRQSEEKETD